MCSRSLSRIINPFSDYAFFMDYNTRKVLDGDNPVFDSDMETEFHAPLDSRLYILSVGHTPETSITHAVEGLYIDQTYS